MLACDSRRQHNYIFTHSPATSHKYNYDNYNNTNVYDNCINNTHEYSQHPHLAAVSPSTSPLHHPGHYNTTTSSAQLMNNYTFSSPSVRVPSATPTYFAGYQQHQQPTPLEQAAFASLWTGRSSGDSTTMAHGSGALQASSIGHGVKRPHQRTVSNSSSIASSYNGHAPSFSYASSPAVGTASKRNGQFAAVDPSRPLQHNLPTPTQTPTQDSFLTTQYQQSFGPRHDQAAMATLAMSNAMDHQSGAEEEVPGMSHSGRHSVSSMGQEPTTPHTVVDGYDGDFKIPGHGESNPAPGDDVEVWSDEYLRFDADADSHAVHRHDRTLADLKQTVPKFDRTMSDVYGDELYDPSAIAQPVKPVTSAANAFLSPFRNTMVSEALQAAENARSQSPNSQLSRGVSPFRPDSPYVQDGRLLQTAAQIRAQQKAQADLNELSQHVSPRQAPAPTTISPKDAVLEYRPGDDAHADVSLFPQDFDAAQAFAGQAQSPLAQNFAAAASYNANNARAQAWGSNGRRQYQSSPLAAPQAQFTFNAPAVAASQFAGIPFDYRQVVPVKSDATPDFPAHLTSMESSASEAPGSSQSSITQQLAATADPGGAGVTKPANGATLADGGAFTCTYHGCSRRFATQQKLQKHKREGHRPNAILPNQQQQHTPGVGSGMSSAALLERNSQSGPHRCDRINPTTGKPCSTVFSRPYDLTRHEDTIHNIRKQKVRCALCVEDKTFSRNDALTRHMRVVHPEVDFPGKHRRRSGGE